MWMEFLEGRRLFAAGVIDPNALLFLDHGVLTIRGDLGGAGEDRIRIRKERQSSRCGLEI